MATRAITVHQMTLPLIPKWMEKAARETFGTTDITQILDMVRR
mgnify:CR=1 FL=1